MKKIKAVIFDLDGTIGDTIPLCIQAFRKSLEPLIDREISDEEIIATFGPSEEGTVMLLAPDNYEKGISDYLYYYEQLHKICPNPFDGITALLTDLKNKNIHLAMVTGKGKISTNITLQKFGLTLFFEIIETGHSIGPRKPEGIIAVLDYFKGLEKNEVIYVGDAPSDIIACKTVGVPIVSAAWADSAEPKKLVELNPDELFYNISDFTEWVNSNI